MKKHTLYFALLGLILSPCCQKKDRFREQDPSDRVQINVEAELPGSRVGLNDARTAYQWESGDVVGLFNDVDDECLSESFLSGEPVSVSVPVGTGNLYAFYPWSAGLTAGPGAVTVEIPSEQSQAEAGTIGRKRYPMAAASPVSDGSASLRFQPLCLTFALNLYKTENWRDDEVVRHVVVTPLNNTRFAGSAQLDLTAAPLPQFTAGDSDASDLVLTLGTPVLLGSAAPADGRTFPGQLYLLMARQEYRQVRFQINTNYALYTLESSSEFVFDGLNYDFLLTGIDLSKGTVTLSPGATGEVFEEQDFVHVSTGDFEPLSKTDSKRDTLTVDIIPDFSRVGYRYGDAPIPNVAVRRTISVDDILAGIAAGTAADTTDFIQKALDEVGASGGGAVLLRNGTYNTSRPLFIGYDNLVLRGESEEGTVIKAIDHRRRRMSVLGRVILTSEIAVKDGFTDESGRLIKITEQKLGGATDKTVGSVVHHDYDVVAASQSFLDAVPISEDLVPSGRMYVEVSRPEAFQVGEDVFVHRPATLDWIHDIWMDRIAANGRDDTNGGGTMQWSERPSTFDKYFERKIVAISGKRLYFDAPLVFEISSKYGGGTVRHFSGTRISGSGIEYLSFDCDYNPSIVYDSGVTSTKSFWGQPYDEMHAWEAVKVVCCNDCWVRNVTSRHMTFACVHVVSRTKRISVLDCKSFDPVSVILGGRRYAFELSGTAQLVLFKNCYTRYDRHSFVSSGGSGGPNVFTNCVAEGSFSSIGPHLNFVPGILYDRCVSNGVMEAQDAGNGGRGHGWRGVNIVYWNCEPNSISINSPQVSGYNYSVGLVGKKVLSTNYNKDYWGGFQDDPYQDYIESLGLLRVEGGYKISRPEGRWYPELAFGASGTQHVSLPFNPGLDWWPRLTLTSFTDPLSLYECQLEDRHARGIYLNNL